MQRSKKTVFSEVRHSRNRIILINIRKVKNFLFRKLSNYLILNSHDRKLKTSITDDNVFPRYCLKASSNEAVFANFRRSDEICSTLEHVTKEQGEEYLIRILKTKNIPLEEIKAVLNQSVGNPIEFKYESVGFANPTTLRYLKVLSDLKTHFGDLLGYHLSEIGVGYGGQAKVITMISSPATYTLVDLSEVIMLARKYLSRSSSFKNFEYIEENNLEKLETDLVISNYAFSELTRKAQDKYLEKIILTAKRGYVTYNSITPKSFNSYTVEEFASKIKNATILDEEPITFNNNKIVVWDNN